MVPGRLHMAQLMPPEFCVYDCCIFGSWHVGLSAFCWEACCPRKTSSHLCLLISPSPLLEPMTLVDEDAIISVFCVLFFFFFETSHSCLTFSGREGLYCVWNLWTLGGAKLIPFFLLLVAYVVLPVGMCECMNKD